MGAAKNAYTEQMAEEYWYNQGEAIAREMLGPDWGGNRGDFIQGPKSVMTEDSNLI